MHWDTPQSRRPTNQQGQRTENMEYGFRNSVGPAGPRPPALRPRTEWLNATTQKMCSANLERPSAITQGILFVHPPPAGADGSLTPA